MDWDKLIDYVYRHLLCSPDKLEVLCPYCHDKLHIRLARYAKQGTPEL